MRKLFVFIVAILFILACDHEEKESFDLEGSYSLEPFDIVDCLGSSFGLTLDFEVTIEGDLVIDSDGAFTFSFSCDDKDSSVTLFDESISGTLSDIIIADSWSSDCCIFEVQNEADCDLVNFSFQENTLYWTFEDSDFCVDHFIWNKND